MRARGLGLVLALALLASGALAQDKKIPIKQKGSSPADNPTARFIANDARHVDDETVARLKGSIIPIAITNAKLHTGKGDVIDGATIVLENGLIKDAGKGVAAPAGAETIDAKGADVTPGLSDGLTSLGLVEIELENPTRDDREVKTDPIHAAFKASDGYNPLSPTIAVARSEGLTSVGVIPRGGLVSGLSAWAELDGATATDAIVRSPLALHVHLEAGSTNGEAAHGQALLLAREAFADARAFSKNKAGFERNQARAFAASRLDLEALASCLDGKLPVVFHVERAADILAALKLAKEEKLKAVIAGGAEAWRVGKELAAAKVPVFAMPLENAPSSFEKIGARDDNAAKLVKAGVLVAISTGDTMNARKLRQVAGNAVRAGLDHEAAISAITKAPAEALGLGAKYGTIEKGKIADVVVWSGDPLELSTRPLVVIVQGKKASLKTRQGELLDRYRKLPAAR